MKNMIVLILFLCLTGLTGCTTVECIHDHAYENKYLDDCYEAIGFGQVAANGIYEKTDKCYDGLPVYSNGNYYMFWGSPVGHSWLKYWNISPAVGVYPRGNHGAASRLSPSPVHDGKQWIWLDGEGGYVSVFKQPS